MTLTLGNIANNVISALTLLGLLSCLLILFWSLGEIHKARKEEGLRIKLEKLDCVMLIYNSEGKELPHELVQKRAKVAMRLAKLTGKTKKKTRTVTS